MPNAETAGREGYSLRRRLLIRLFGALALLTAGLFAFVDAYAQRAADSAYDQLLQAAALSIADTIRVEGGRIAVDLPYSSLSILAMARRDRIFYRIDAPGGGLVTGYGDLPVTQRVAGDRNTAFQNATYRDMPIRLAVLDRLIAHPQLSGWVRIVVAQTREERESLARGILTNAFLPIALAVMAGGGLIWFGVRQALAPLASLEQMIRARQPHDFRPIEIPPPAEVSQLVQAINSLLARLHGNLDTMQTFLADAAHQIRTPLASLRLQAELAAEEDDPESLRRSVARIHRNAVEASQLTSQLLSHAMVIHRSEALEPENIDLAALLDHVVQRARPISDDVLIRLDIDEAAEQAFIAGDPISLTEAMTNLVDNAVKYAGQGGDVTVRLGPLPEGGFQIDVADRGPGIPDAEKEGVLQRFGRGSAGTGTIGSGLGLAIVKAVADAHGGGLRLLDRPGGGLIVRLEFPQAPASGSATRSGLLLVTGAACLLTLLLPFPALAVEPVVYPAPAGERHVLLIDAATDRTLMEPLILDFQRIAPTVTVSYSDFSTRDLYERTESGQTDADLVISSASDLQVKLINDGFSQPYESSATQALPDWANWRDEAFGFTVEPAVIAYNRDLVPEQEVPRSRNDLIRLIRENGARYNRRVATYDAATSGIGYLFATQDSVLFSQYWQLMVTLGAAQARLACCTGDILEMIERGEVLIAYNMLGSYARARMVAGARIGIVLPEDYTLVMSRVAIIPAKSRRADLAGSFIDYLLSQRGQEIISSQSALFSLTPGIQEDAVLRGDRAASTGPVIPITLSPALLVFLDKFKRESFLRQWHLAFQTP
ncbi:MAG TPA: extracellular solute-binding protein [Skermanella sp.]|nr:extracellular solute-binding protein [Skermanella sp.]